MVRQLRDFFEDQLCGLYRWQTAGDEDTVPPAGTIRLRASEKHEKLPGRRQLEKEVAIVDFDSYSLVVSSPEEVPPIGRILLYNTVSGERLEGPLDQATWSQIGEAIKRVKGSENVERR